MHARWVGLGSFCAAVAVVIAAAGCGDNNTGSEDDARSGDVGNVQDSGDDDDGSAEDDGRTEDDGSTPPLTSELVVLAWNDLGMHCLNPSYDELVILPPYNTLWAQLIEPGDPPRIVTTGVTVEYRILNNTSSADKGDYGRFWDNAEALFGVALETDKGLNLVDPERHNGLAGQMVSAGDHFEVHGIPVTPINDNLLRNPYQIAEITVRNRVGTVLGQTQATVPTSDEINCSNCHGADAFQDILNEHPRVDGNSLVDMQPVLCASCHGSPALGSPAGDRGSAGTYLSEAIHGSHADRTDPLENPIACYDCHPGPQTKCHRSVAHTAFDGNCESCHDSMAHMASAIEAGTKTPWIDEPACTGCHMDVAQVDTGATLYRNASGHGGLYCPACHQSPHALIPSELPADNYQAIQYQDAAVSIGSCAACHDNSRGPDEPFEEFLEKHTGANPEEKTACHVCHTTLATSAVTDDWPHEFEWRPR